jgi:hypothetical protein
LEYEENREGNYTRDIKGEEEERGENPRHLYLDGIIYSIYVVER